MPGMGTGGMCWRRSAGGPYNRRMASHYLDHAATTPILASAREACVDELGRAANPHALHRSGRRARAVVEDARKDVAALLAHLPEAVERAWCVGQRSSSPVLVIGGSRR